MSAGGIARLLALVVLAGALAGCGPDEPGAGVTSPPAAPVALTQEQLDAMRVTFASPKPAAVERALKRIAAAEPPTAWLLEGLLHPDRGVREWSAHALGDLAPQDDGVVRALVLSFEDVDDYVRWKAARALGNIGPRSAIALPLLEAAAEAEHEVEVVRAASARAVEQIR
ncbi:MAG: HEAT repeat domain-containing protein [Planctomycetota bacterium]|nr:HEAT repeat domain-containing protein [Planctomycetota bacterium]